MTIAEMITSLQKKAKEFGEDTRVVLYDEYLANEGWGFEPDDLFYSADVSESLTTLESGEKVLLIE